MEGHLFQFAILFGVLGLAATASIWLRFPVVPLYIAAGLALGTVIETNEVVEFLGSLGVVFLLFSMGLEFSLGSVSQAPRRFVTAGSIDMIFNFPVGLLAGLAMGWGWIESMFLAGILYMSSSAVVAKCIADFGRATRPETETILSIMVFEDLAIAAYLLLLNALTIGGRQTMETSDYLISLLSILVFLGVLFIVLTRRLQEPIARLLATRTGESFTLLLFAFVLLVASAAIAVNLSEAIGAFIAGVVLGSTDLKERAAATLHPFQTLFAALFFVSFGMGIEVSSMLGVAAPAIVLIVLGIATKTVGGYLAGRSAGHTPAQSAAVGLSLVPKGEFSILIAGLAAGVASEGSDIVALTVVYVFALSIIGPVTMREADRIWKAIT